MKRGFTLAEVLITLGIIGIVAAMTLPAMVQKYKEQETVTKVKKFYSVFSQAYTRAILDNARYGLLHMEIWIIYIAMILTSMVKQNVNKIAILPQVC